MTPRPNRCEALSSPSYLNFTLSLLILLGILISYLPQHHRIITRRSSDGISPYFVLLGSTSATCAFATILLLPASRADLACCTTVSAFQCFAALLGVAQVGVAWACFTLVLLLFLLYHPRAPSPPAPASPTATATPPTPPPSYRTALLVTTTSIIHLAITFALSLIILARYPHHLHTWATTLGVLATVLASVQYLPQLHTTWRRKDVGSLSIPMMCVQTPGSFVWAGSLAARVGVKGWSAWVVYVVTGCLQGVLLGMGVWFEVGRRRKGGEGGVEGLVVDGRGGGGGGDGDGVLRDERTPLLGGEG